MWRGRPEVYYHAAADILIQLWCSSQSPEHFGDRTAVSSIPDSIFKYTRILAQKDIFSPSEYNWETAGTFYQQSL